MSPSAPTEHVGQGRKVIGHRIATSSRAILSLPLTTIPVYMLGVGWCATWAARFFEPLFGSLVASHLIVGPFLTGSLYLIWHLVFLDFERLSEEKIACLWLGRGNLRRIVRILAVSSNLLVFVPNQGGGLAFASLLVWWFLAGLVLPGERWLHWLAFVVQLGCVQLALSLPSYERKITDGAS